MEMEISFPGGKRVDASFDGFTVRTDQPTDNGGDGSAPSPFELFLAALGTCAGIYVLGFCKARNLPTDGVRLTQRLAHDAQGHLAEVVIDIHLPPDFPEKYRPAVIRAAEQCKVKQTIEHPPRFVVQTVLG